MALLTESGLRARARRTPDVLVRADSVLTEQVRKQEQVETYDVFLSHAYEDKELILGVALTIEDLGFKVYVDWRDDSQLDRARVTRETATRLRERMQNSRSLLYSTTTQAKNSKWMPWELGYKDGHSGRVAILPVSATDAASDQYSGQEYLGVYPYVTKDRNKKGEDKFWVHRSETKYVVLDNWLKGEEPSEHP
jgi:TIR domain